MRCNTFAFALLLRVVQRYFNFANCWLNLHLPCFVAFFSLFAQETCHTMHSLQMKRRWCQQPGTLALYSRYCIFFCRACCKPFKYTFLFIVLLLGPAQFSLHYHGNTQARTPFAVTIDRIAKDQSGEVSVLYICMLVQ